MRRLGTVLSVIVAVGLVLLVAACSESTVTLDPPREMAAEDEAAALSLVEASFRIDPAWVITKNPRGSFGGPSFMAEPDPDSGNRILVWVVANRTLPAEYTPEQWVTTRIQTGLDSAETAQDATLSPQVPVTIGHLHGYTTEVSGFRGAGTGQPLQGRFDVVFGSEHSYVFYVENELDDRDWMRRQFAILTENVEFPAVEHPVAAGTTPPSSTAWSRVPHDEAAFGGPGPQSMMDVTAGGPGLVAVGHDQVPGGDANAAVWTSTDGIAWSRVPHDEAVFGGGDGNAMLGVTAGGPGLVAVGGDGERVSDSAAVWVYAEEG